MSRLGCVTNSGHRGHDRMEAGFLTTYAIGAFHH